LLICLNKTSIKGEQNSIFDCSLYSMFEFVWFDSLGLGFIWSCWISFIWFSLLLKKKKTFGLVQFGLTSFHLDLSIWFV
jgi:hypothetical protein